MNVKNFKKIIDDLTALPQSNKLSGNKLLDAIEGLYRQYNVPDRRTQEQKTADRAKYLTALDRARKEKEYPIDDTKIIIAYHGSRFGIPTKSYARAAKCEQKPIESYSSRDLTSDISADCGIIGNIISRQNTPFSTNIVVVPPYLSTVILMLLVP